MDKIYFSKEILDNPDEVSLLLEQIVDRINELIDTTEDNDNRRYRREETN